MATETYIQTVQPSMNTRHQHSSTSSQRHAHFRREHTAPPSSCHPQAEISPTRFSPYSKNLRPVNIVYGVHTSLDLRPYKSPADEFLPQIKDPTQLEGMPPETEITKAQNALALAQAVRSTSHAHQVYLRTQIAEGEAILAILRKKAEDAEERLQQADHQLGSLRGHLDRRGISHRSIIDDYMLEYEAVERAYRPLDNDEEVDDDDENSAF